MLLGPIFRAEMVTSARRRRYFVLRVVYAILILFLLWGSYAQLTYYGRQISIQDVASVTASFFYSYAWLQLLGVLAVGPAMVAGTIATERSRRTIEYLFATQLSNSEIVLGKLTARLLSVAYLVAVGLPILAIFRLLGGIPAEQLLLVFAVTGSTMVLVASVSICISVWSQRPRDAVMRSYLFLIAFLFVPLMLTPGPLLSLPQWLQDANGYLLSVNPVWMMASISMGFSFPVAGTHPIRDFLLGQTGISLVCIGLATMAVRQVHLRASGAPAKRRRWESFSLPRLRLPLGAEPMLWKELFARHSITRLGVAGRIVVLLLVGAVTTLNVATYTASSYASVGARQYFAASMGAAVGCVGLLLIAARAAGAVAGEKEEETWDAVLSTPLSARQIVLAKFAGNLYAARWLVVFLLTIWVPGLHQMSGFLFRLALLLATFGVLLLFAVGLGTWSSMISKTSLRALGPTLVIAFFVGGGYFFCCIPVFFVGTSPLGEIMLAPCIPFLLYAPAVVLDTDVISIEPNLVDAYIVGMIGYTCVSLLMVFTAIASFDTVQGRLDAITSEMAARRAGPKAMRRTPPATLQE
ncbi:MAG: ABC transporter permease [Pirellulales bacterium]